MLEHITFGGWNELFKLAGMFGSNVSWEFIWNILTSTNSHITGKCLPPNHELIRRESSVTTFIGFTFFTFFQLFFWHTSIYRNTKKKNIPSRDNEKIKRSSCKYLQMRERESKRQNNVCGKKVRAFYFFPFHIHDDA